LQQQKLDISPQDFKLISPWLRVTFWGNDVNYVKIPLSILPPSKLSFQYSLHLQLVATTAESGDNLSLGELYGSSLEMDYSGTPKLLQQVADATTCIY